MKTVSFLKELKYSQFVVNSKVIQFYTHILFHPFPLWFITEH